MKTQIIQDWTDSRVAVDGEELLHVRYRVYRQGGKILQDIHSDNGEPLDTLELPNAMLLEKANYELLLQYALTDVIAA